MTDLCETKNWIVEKVLGTGGFGTVSLWRNKNTNEKLAVKKCRLGNDPIITPKHKERWNLEVEIMQKLNHSNVVKALQIPQELDVAPGEMPVLAMEYCSKGDLRKILNYAENCCGISETKVRNLVWDISCALNYLHSRRIIHRDLKPENIMVQDVEGKFVYKLTDLGYAKELDQISVCTSFVGTLQYLAPELFMSQEYTCTVDYWSLGLVAHECMVGVRPFLPNLAPAEWMKHVCRKKSTDICVYMSPGGIINFSEHIFKENHLSKPFVIHIEKWLQVMLEWKPYKRGIDVTSGTKRFITHSLLEEILTKKIVHCFVVGTGELCSYEIEENTLTQQVLERLCRDLEVSREDFDCFLPRGDVITDDRPATDLHCSDLMDDEEWICFIFYKNKYDVNRVKYPDLSLVTGIMAADESTDLNRENQLRVWSHAFYFIAMEMKLEKRLKQAFEVLKNYLVLCNSSMVQKVKEMTSEMNKLTAKLEFYQECVNADKAAYNLANTKHQISSHQLEESLNNQSEDIAKEVDQLQDVVTKQEITTNAITVDLRQRFCNKDIGSIADIDELYKRAVETYTAFRSKQKERRVLCSERKCMADIITQCIDQRESRMKQHFVRLQRNQDCKQHICKALLPFDRIMNSIKNTSRRLMSLQIDRQRLIWKAFNSLITMKHERANYSLSSSLCSGGDLPVSEPVSLKSIVNKVSEDSLKTIKENQHLRAKWDTQFASLDITRTETLNWDFMKKVKRNQISKETSDHQHEQK